MSWQKEVDEIARRRKFAEDLGGADAVARQHAAGRMTVRERIAKIGDPGSFREIGAMAGKATYDKDHNLVSVRPSNAVIGTIKIGGGKVSIDGGDWTIRGGSSQAPVSE